MLQLDLTLSLLIIQLLKYIEQLETMAKTNTGMDIQSILQVLKTRSVA